MSGIVGYGSYLPYHRLDRAAIGASLGARPGRGTRSVASYDEDATTMAVAAGRRVRLPGDLASLYLTTTTPPYLDKTNANAVHAALALDPAVGAYDMAGSVRSTIGAIRAALASGTTTLVIASDLRTGLPGSDDERDGGDGSAALLFGPGTDDAPVIAEYLGGGSATAEFLERWRVPGAPASGLWEDRFGMHVLLPMAGPAVAAALSAAGVAPDGIDRVIVTGTHTRAVRALSRMSGFDPQKTIDDLGATIGNTGAAHPALLLAAALDVAEPGEVIALVVLADGAEVLLFRATDSIESGRSAPSVADQVATAGAEVPYATFLTWRGFLDRQPPRRPPPSQPAAPPSARSDAWKFGFTATRCQKCATVHLPPQRVCVECSAVDHMEPVRLADVPGTIATFTVDRLAFSPSPPVVAAVVDFDGGGRFQVELTDVDPDAVAIGDRVSMTFRRIATVDGVHNYFWKAQPLQPTGDGAPGQPQGD